MVVTAPDGEPKGVALIAHPHPLHGGTLDNKVVQTLARAFTALRMAAVRFNFRGVGQSEGVFDEGAGEIQDMLAVASEARREFPGLPLVLGGFSFGGYVAAATAQALEPQRVVLVAPAVDRFPVPSVPAGTLVMHGEEDDVVRLPDLMTWARPQQLPVVVFPGTGHFFHGRLVPLQAFVMHYFSDLAP